MIRAAESGDTAIALAALAANPVAGDPDRADCVAGRGSRGERPLAAAVLPERMMARRPPDVDASRDRRDPRRRRTVPRRGSRRGRRGCGGGSTGRAGVCRDRRSGDVGSRCSPSAISRSRPSSGSRPGLAAPSITTIYGATIRWRGGLVIAVSQSGRSPDLVAVIEAAREDGAMTIAIANDAASPLADAAEHLIDCRAGEELAVAATKSYVAQLAAGAALVAALGDGERLNRGLESLPAVLGASSKRRSGRSMTEPRSSRRLRRASARS